VSLSLDDRDGPTVRARQTSAFQAGARLKISTLPIPEKQYQRPTKARLRWVSRTILPWFAARHLVPAVLAVCSPIGWPARKALRLDRAATGPK
jgi:hypothetical protein